MLGHTGGPDITVYSTAEFGPHVDIPDDGSLQQIIRTPSVASLATRRGGSQVGREVRS